MKELNQGWSADVDRGPDWLLVRLHAPNQELEKDAHLAEGLLSLLKKHLVRRMVLELDDIERLQGDLVDELVDLHDRVNREGGVLRICGLSDESQQALRGGQHNAQFPVYRDRREAVMAPRVRFDKAHS